MNRYRIARDQAEQQAEELAGRLQSILSPVEARPEFVQGLKTRLVMRPSISMEYRSQATAMVAVAIGLFTGALLAWWIFRLRAFFYRR